MTLYTDSVWWTKRTCAECTKIISGEKARDTRSVARFKSCECEIELDERRGYYFACHCVCCKGRWERKKSTYTQGRNFIGNIRCYTTAKTFPTLSHPPPSNIPFDLLYIPLTLFQLSTSSDPILQINVLARATRVVDRLFHAALTIAGCKQRPGTPLMDVPDNWNVSSIRRLAFFAKLFEASFVREGECLHRKRACTNTETLTKRYRTFDNSQVRGDRAPFLWNFQIVRP